jgi:ubiquinone/menaquinone biosynthesis C-methylase UbiE
LRYKNHFAQSYNDVADAVGQRSATAEDEEMRVVARLRRSVARALMQRLGYSEDELNMIGEDVDKMQGTGNPFPSANLRRGETVLDLGSGFGVDAMLAGKKVGPEGRVVGVDLSEREVAQANRRVLSRGVENVRFYTMDMEELSAIPDGSIDCVISNGGFCLVPNKRKAFREIRRVLKPGTGRFSISCTTLRKGYGSINKFMTDEDAQAAANFPSCMEVFLPLDAAEPLLQDLGFRNVSIDLSNSKMSVWRDVEESMRDDVERELARLHGALPERGAEAEARREAVEMARLAADTGRCAAEADESVAQTGAEVEAGSSEDSVASEQRRSKGVHTGGDNPRYAHMSSLSMDDICARVVIYGLAPDPKEE